VAIDVVIRRKFEAGKADALAPLIVKMRSLATVQSGYISGETFRLIDPPEESEFLVVSVWRSVEDWKRWLHSSERTAIQQEIDALTRTETEYRIYESLVGGIIPKLNV